MMNRNPLHTDGRWFKDEEGRVVILRGVNVAGNSKVPPFVPFRHGSFFDPLARWGMNVIRLVLVWEAIEPQPGQYNNGYIDAVESLVTAAGERGVYVILDMHQDMFSRYLDGGCGDGCPSWAIDPSIPQDTPVNDHTCIGWYMGISDDRVLRAFDSFFRNVNGVQSRYVAMWAHMAKRFSAHPAVIGYDIIKEPIGDEVSQIAPFYEEVGATIRQADPDCILFIESDIVATISAGQSQLPRLSLGNFAYAPHFYSPSMTVLDTFVPAEAETAFAAFDAKANDLGGIPLLLGEFGAPPFKACVSEYMADLYRRIDERFWSGTQWNYTPEWDPVDFDRWNKEDFSIVDDKGSPRRNFAVRACAQRVAGTPRKLEVSSERVYFEWDNDPRVAAATILYVPVDIVFQGSAYDIVGGPSVRCEVDRQNRLLTCTTSGSGIRTVEVKAT
ncbi:MAG: cellulase family glycosylhydrolase [Chloroflexota bacterium]|nr:cellulase family glycosylhydrolase [Chloroflexota bacterium]